MLPHQKELEQLTPQFTNGDQLKVAHTLHGGLINATYLVETASKLKIVLQRVNTSVFTKPELVMHNIRIVTAHLETVAPQERNLKLITDSQGATYILDGAGGLWRAFNYLSRCVGHESVATSEQAREAGSAFGTFLHQMEGLDPSLIKETIPDFHNTPQRYQTLLTAVENDSAQRVTQATPELLFIKERAFALQKIETLRKAGTLPNRITHNDTKISNILFDKESDRAVCVIDLDTVMPGTMLYDFGDLVRTSVNRAREDQELSAVECRLDVFEALARGYLTVAHDILVEEELELLVYSAQLITLELGIRFLTDFIEGDRYFKVTHEHQNLDRAKNQLRLVALLEKNAPEMEAIIARIRDDKHLL